MKLNERLLPPLSPSLSLSLILPSLSLFDVSTASSPQLYPFPPAIIPSFSGNERSRGGNAICRDDGRKWASRVVSASVQVGPKGEEVKADTGSPIPANRVAPG